MKAQRHPADISRTCTDLALGLITSMLGDDGDGYHSTMVGLEDEHDERGHLAALGAVSGIVAQLLLVITADDEAKALVLWRDMAGQLSCAFDQVPHFGYE